MQKYSPSIRWIVISTLCASFFLLVCTPGHTQKQARKIIKESWPSEPIKVMMVKNSHTTVELGKAFDEDDDWLKGLTVTVRNNGERAIARIVLRLDFLRPPSSSPDEATYVARMSTGRDPSVLINETLPLIQPGEQTDVKLLEVNLPLISSDLRTLGYPETITRVRLLVESVTFADGSMWMAGQMLYPDPSNPSKKINPKFHKPSVTNRPPNSLSWLRSGRDGGAT